MIAYALPIARLYLAAGRNPHALPSHARGGAFWRAGRPHFDKLSCAISAN